MIIQIRGTSGSGKSTVMRAVMDHLGKWVPAVRSGRRNPLYYSRRTEKPCYHSESVTVLGHYNTTCGGCDTVGSARAVYGLIQEIREGEKRRGWSNSVILCEGLLLSEDVKWSSQMPDLRCLFLTTSLERCLRQISGRRAEAGNDKPLNSANTENRVGTIERARLRLIEAGVKCLRCSSRQAPEIVLRWIDEARNNQGQAVGVRLREGVTPD